MVKCGKTNEYEWDIFNLNKYIQVKIYATISGVAYTRLLAVTVKQQQQTKKISIIKMQNIIGNRGEYIFAELITEKTDNGYLFNPAFLGEKWPTSDFYVELFNTEKPMFCFFQIKSTSNGYTKKEKKIKANVTKEDLEKLSNLPAPSYVIGIDEQQKKGFIISTNGIEIKAINTLPTNHPINKENIKKLWEEVKEFWEKSQNKNYKDNDFKSNFKI